ncbi:PerC family transcriptional regulator [Leclercia adecarboxylata]|uniref:PerC family transcriptional regulator n=1 Tax=Leclercia adecarboxylata TaxID=83655 RepID=UPI002448EB85|nr:PerC family transcriptional regulator [Leclercia adecarboxylata]MDH0063183.1 PerC family transcriptional regulator [Leclercia adecarboxylata]
MSIESEVLQFALDNPGCSTRQVANVLTHTSFRTISRCLFRFHNEGKLKREVHNDTTIVYYPCEEFVKTDAAATASYADTVRTLTDLENYAIQLEGKGLYLRAATVWLNAFDLSPANKDRERYVKRRASCLKQAKKRCVTDACLLAGHYIGEEQ